MHSSRRFCTSKRKRIITAKTHTSKQRCRTSTEIEKWRRWQIQESWTFSDTHGCTTTSPNQQNGRLIGTTLGQKVQRRNIILRGIHKCLGEFIVGNWITILSRYPVVWYGKRCSIRLGTFFEAVHFGIGGRKAFGVTWKNCE